MMTVRHFHIVALLLAGLIVAGSGCTSSMTPGKMEWVQADSDKDRAGNVYLLRGWIGIFSHGIDALTDKINDKGVRAHQYQDDQWNRLADTIIAKYKDEKNYEPIVLVGHSYGADDVVRVAEKLNKVGIKVDLLITLDPVTPPSVPNNVGFAYNLFQSNGAWDNIPVLRGVPLKNSPERMTGKLENLDIRKEHTELLEEGTDHFNIEKKEKIHNAVIEQILAACPPRAQWVSMRQSTPQTAKTSPSQSTQLPKTTPTVVPTATGGATTKPVAAAGTKVSINDR